MKRLSPTPPCGAAQAFRLRSTIRHLATREFPPGRRPSTSPGGAGPRRPDGRPPAGGTPAATGAPASTGTEQAGVEGLVLGPDHAALAGFLVSATGFEGEGGANLTDARGYYRIEGLPPGSYLISLNSIQNQERPCYSAFEDRIVTLKKGELATVNFGVEAGTRIHGAVLAEGQRVAGALVTLISLAGLSAGQSVTGDGGGLSTKNATSDAAGLFSLQGVLPGTYTLIVTHPDDPTRIARVTLDVPAVAERRLDVLFTRLGISGRAIDSGTGQPLQGVAVCARKRDSAAPNNLLEGIVAAEMTSVFSDEEGNFRFTSLDPGSYTLVGMLEGYATAAAAATVMPEGEPAPVTLALAQGGGQFEGLVHRAGGQPMTNAYLAIQDGQGNDLVLRRVEMDGRFQSGHLAAGAYTVVLYIDGTAVDRLSVTLERDVITKQEFVVE
ncbi:MAG: carboxypeptidase regulatory-like domain-containing protein [Planctomycetes bacterium]|nr:carboxypeptidase regulatory-like domain-containing protein [Planctomycetota bacterium]